MPTGVRGGKRYKSFVTAAEAKRWRAPQIAAGRQSRTARRVPGTHGEAGPGRGPGARGDGLLQRTASADVEQKLMTAVPSSIRGVTAERDPERD